MPNDLAEFAADMASEMPTPNENAISVEAEKAAERGAGLTDSSGNGFDPDLHVTDPEGNPVLTKTGKLRMRPGRKGTRANSTLKADAPQAYRDTSREAGKATAQAIFALGRTLGGEEWAPIIDEETGVNEPAQMESAFSDYYKHKGIQDIPPGVALSIAILGYTLPRLTMPKTKSRLQKIKGFIGEKIGAWRGRKIAEEK